jgi:hypothetical protein
MQEEQQYKLVASSMHFLHRRIGWNKYRAGGRPFAAERGFRPVSGLIETQATAEKGRFFRAQLNELIDLAEVGLKEIFAAQQAVLAA